MVMFLEKPRFDPTSSATSGEESTAGDILDATLESMRLGENANSRLVAFERAYDKRIDDIKGAVGTELSNPVTNSAGPSSMAGFGIQEETDPHAAFQSQIEGLAEQHPEQREVIAPHRPVSEDAKALALSAEKRSEDVWSRSSGGLAAWSARLAGGFYGAMHDPVNIFTMAVGPAGHAAKGAKGLLWMGLKQGAANAATEAAIQPAVQSWRKEAGMDYGLGQAAINVGGAAVFGFGLDAGVRGLVRGGRRLAGRPYLGPDEPAPGGAEHTGARLPGLPEGRAAETAPPAPRVYRGADPLPPMEALEQAARNAPEGSTLRRAADGDEDAMRELAAALGPDADPAIRRALDEIEIEKLFPTPLNVDDGAHLHVRQVGAGLGLRVGERPLDLVAQDARDELALELLAAVVEQRVDDDAQVLSDDRRLRLVQLLVEDVLGVRHGFARAAVLLWKAHGEPAPPRHLGDKLPTLRSIQQAAQPARADLVRHLLGDEFLHLVAEGFFLFAETKVHGSCLLLLGSQGHDTRAGELRGVRLSRWPVPA